MVSTVVAGPPSDGTLDGTTTNSGEEDLERKGGGVGSVCPQTMVSGGDSQTSSEVVGNGPNGGLEIERSPGRVDQTNDWNTDDESDVEPVDVLVPVLACDWGVGDVSLVWTVVLVAVWLIS